MRLAFAFFIGAVSAMPMIAVAAPGIDLRQLHDPNFDSPIHAHGSMAPVTDDLESNPANRPANIDVQHYDIDIAVDPRIGSIRGTVAVTFSSTVQRLTSVELDALDMQIVAVRGDGGAPLAFTYDGAILSTQLERALTGSETARITIEYVALTPQEMATAGPDVTSPQRVYQAYTYTEPDGSKTWFPCLDRPNDKATSNVTITVPEGYEALSNGDLMPQQQKSDGTAVFSYRMEFPIATYLTSLAIGDYEIRSIGEYNGKPLSVWAPADVIEAAVRETANTSRMMEIFGAFTGTEYAFNSYSQSVAQAWRTSMEHQSATTMGGWRISGDGTGESVVAHELAHQWFGDLVTCRTWGELWLNEGFASYLPYVYFDHIGAVPQAIGQIDYWRLGYFDEANNYSAHALSSPNPDMTNLFDSHAYEKGGLVLHLMRAVANRMPLGMSGERLKASAPLEETFTGALRRYLNDRRFGNATSEDLQRAMEAQTGQSWQTFFDQWVRSAGHPILAITPVYEGGVLTLTVEQTQNTRAENAWGLFSFPLEVEVIATDGTVTYEAFDMYDDVQTFTIPMGAAPLAVNIDPDWILPAEFTLVQNDAAWLEVLRHSPIDKSRITAMRSLSPAARADAATVALIKADTSRYLKADAMAKLSTGPENRAAVSEIYAVLGAEPDLDVATRDALALTEAWLVSSVGSTPTRDDERRWQDRFAATPSTTERQALLTMLKVGSVERAQAFAVARLAEPQWVTRDRWRMLDLLGSETTPASQAFYVQLLDLGTAPVYFSTVAGALINRGYDDPAVVPGLLRVAAGDRLIMSRGKALDLLAKQVASKETVCPALTELQSTAPVAIRDQVGVTLRTLACGE